MRIATEHGQALHGQAGGFILKGDREILAQMLSNLVKNAGRSSPGSGPGLALVATIAGRHRGNMRLADAGGRPARGDAPAVE